MQGLKKTERSTTSNFIGTVTMKTRMEKAFLLMDSVEEPPRVRKPPTNSLKLKTNL